MRILRCRAISFHESAGLRPADGARLAVGDQSAGRGLARRRPGLLVRALPAALAVAVVFAASAPAQKLPGRVPSAPERGEVKRPVKIKLPRQSPLGLLIVITAPAAEILLDGVKVGVADEDGQFERQVPPGAHRLEVRGGEEFAPYSRELTIRKQQREIVNAELESLLADVLVVVPRLDESVLSFGGVRVARVSGEGAGGAKLEMLAGLPDNAAATLELAPGEKTIAIRRLRPGEYALVYENPKYAPIRQSLRVSAGESYLVSLRPEAATVELRVASEPGTRVLVDGALLGEIGAGGELAGSVAPGEHEVRLERPGYRPLVERLLFNPEGPMRVERRLDPAISTASFGEDFELGLGRWTHGPGWSVADGQLQVGGSPTPGIASAVIYDDFVLSFNLTLLDGGGAAWVLRARDPQSYYLFHLSGPQGRYPNRFLVYVVRDGRFDPESPASAPLPIGSALVPGGEYYVEVTAIGKRIETKLTPLATGVVESLGVFEDALGVYPFGGIGFRSVASERFSVDDCYADPPRR